MSPRSVASLPAMLETLMSVRGINFARRPICAGNRVHIAAKPGEDRAGAARIKERVDRFWQSAAPVQAFAIGAGQIDRLRFPRKIIELRHGEQGRRARDEGMERQAKASSKALDARCAPSISACARSASSSASFSARRAARAASAVSGAISPKACFSAMSAAAHQPSSVGKSCVETQAMAFFG